MIVMLPSVIPSMSTSRCRNSWSRIRFASLKGMEAIPVTVHTYMIARQARMERGIAHFLSIFPSVLFFIDLFG